MDVGTALSAVQTLFAALQCTELQDILSSIGYKSQLDELRKTVSAINAVLLDAEAKQELSNEEQYKLNELKDAVFEADDLLDEFATLAQQKQLLKTDRRLHKKLRSLFSEAGAARRMSRGVKKIKKKLKDLADNTQFSFKHDPKPILRRESCSHVDAGDIIGRKDELEKIVGMMLDPNVKHDVSYLTIVGIGGLGKTAVAQLVYNDTRVKSAFPLRLWACVSDQDQKQLYVKDVLSKILASATNSKLQTDFTLDEVQNRLRGQLAGKKYLLVLDDVWSEDRHQLRDLERFLSGGQRGSWILVTTRSQLTAKNIGDATKHDLQGLSEENSWLLFKTMAFGSQSSDPPHDLVEIGQKILQGCPRVPLAIRVVGSLLYGQHKGYWLSFAQIPLANLEKSQTDIMPILKLSYHNLESPLKSCFGYCALYPKDYRMEKSKLINLWMAQGYIVSFDGRSIEDVAEEYFSTLLQQCFFQDVEIYGRDDTMYFKMFFKMHDLMHDVAQMVTKQEICATNNLEGSLNNKVRHMSVTIDKVASIEDVDKSNFRTFLVVGYKHQLVEVKSLMANCIRLRALDLSYASVETLPESIGELLHLRYLNLSDRYQLEVLPKSITKLCNLQTLILSNCYALKELPKDLSRLVKLRMLLTYRCSKLTCFPKGMGELTSLCRLSNFIVGGKGSDSTMKQWLDGLEDLKAMNNLKGHLKINFNWPKNGVKQVGDSRNVELYLSNKEHLKGVTFRFSYGEVDGGVDSEEATRFMEQLQPHSNLESLKVRLYRGVSMPGWITLLPKLVIIELVDCQELEFMPPGLGKLQHLKELSLKDLPKLEYIEIIPSSFRSEVAQGVSIFPSLKILYLDKLPKLKALGDDVHLLEDNKYVQLHLTRMTIWSCPELTCISLQTLGLYRCENLRSVCGGLQHLAALKTLDIRECPNLMLAEETEDGRPWRSLHHSLRILGFSGLPQLVSLPDWMQSLSALEMIRISDCKRLESLPGWMPKLSSLKQLLINGCSESLKSRCQKNPPGEDWDYIKHIPNIFINGVPLRSPLKEF